MATNSQTDGQMTEDQLFDDELVNLIGELMAKYHLAGMSINVIDQGKSFAKGFGIARYPELPATPSTLWFTGSTTKAMLAAAVGIIIHGKDHESSEAATLRENKWDTRVKSILPDFELEDDYATENLTVEDALCHRSGKASADITYGSWQNSGVAGIVESLKYLGPLEKLFRTTWQYNNLMYSTVGELLHKVTGLDCGAMLKKLIWDPLEMTSTYWHMEQVPSDKRGEIARGYQWIEGEEGSGGYYVAEPYIDFAGIAPAGATISTVVDYGEWIKELLKAASEHKDSVQNKTAQEEEEKPSSDESVISSRLFTELTSPKIVVAGSQGRLNPHLNNKTYALAWFVESPAAGTDHPIVTHSGSLTGFGTQLFLLPNDDFGVVTVGNNQAWAKVVGKIACLELMARKLGLKGEERKKFVDRLKDEIPPFAGAGTSEAGDTLGNEKSPQKQEHPPIRDSPENRERLQRMVGEYSHPAYGPYRVSLYDAEEQDRVIYTPYTPYADRKERDAKRQQNACLFIEPIGHRTWKFKIIAHARDDEASSHHNLITTTEDAAGSDGANVFFDLEFMDGHGNVEDDVVKGFPTGAEEKTPSGVEVRAERAWGSQRVCKNFAAFHYEDGRGAPTTAPAGLYLRLKEEDLDGTEGTTDEGWKKKMFWFSKR